MLRRLYIKNLVLVEECLVDFQKGFHVITGETGAGKSIILSSLSLLLGTKADSSLIRQGASCAVVEASFDRPNIEALFVEIECEPNDELVIRRELTATGKSRTFVNDQAVGVAFLKKLASHLLEISSQHGHIELLEEDCPLILVDRYAELEETKAQFAKAYASVQALQRAIGDYSRAEAARHRLMETCRREIEEIEEAKAQEGEDEELFTEYSKLATQAECAGTISEIVALLDQDEPSALSLLAKAKLHFDRLGHKSTSFLPLSDTFKRAFCDLQEVSFELTRSMEESSQAQERFSELEERLKRLHDLKKKFGPTLKEVLAYKEKQQGLLRELEKQELTLDELTEALKAEEAESNKLAKELSQRRTKAASTLCKKITDELVQLNMPHAIFKAILHPCERTSSGDERCEFQLTPNRGQSAVNVQKGISGGELARLMLAIKCVMIGKSPVGTILFDEIDANIGGKTASIVGKKLSLLGKSCQVIAVTHFAQVAMSADVHYRIEKLERDFGTTSHIQLLDTVELRQYEITRMLGGSSLDIAKIPQSAYIAKKI